MTVDMKDPFISMLVHAFIAAFVGAIGGLIMVNFIGLVAMLFANNAFNPLTEGGEIIWPAMCMGSMVGAILGGVAGLRKAK